MPSSNTREMHVLIISQPQRIDELVASLGLRTAVKEMPLFDEQDARDQIEAALSPNAEWVTKRVGRPSNVMRLQLCAFIALSFLYGPRPGTWLQSDGSTPHSGQVEALRWRDVDLRRGAKDHFGWTFYGHVRQIYLKGHKYDDSFQ